MASHAYMLADLTEGKNLYEKFFDSADEARKGCRRYMVNHPRTIRMSMSIISVDRNGRVHPKYVGEVYRFSSSDPKYRDFVFVSVKGKESLVRKDGSLGRSI